jgi:hypothetical protein
VRRPGIVRALIIRPLLSQGAVLVKNYEPRRQQLGFSCVTPFEACGPALKVSGGRGGAGRARFDRRHLPGVPARLGPAPSGVKLRIGHTRSGATGISLDLNR